MQYLESLFDTVQSVELDALTFSKDIGITCAILLAFSLLGRMIFGNRSNLNHASSSALGILAELSQETLYQHVRSMVILAFLVNLFDTWLPRGAHVLTWFFWR